MEAILKLLTDWAAAQPSIQAVALVGSYARGEAQPDSDLDLVLLAHTPMKFRADTVWLQEIDWQAANVQPRRWRDEDYGVLWSRRLWLDPHNQEIEFGFAPASWANTDPLDSGTSRVISDGCRILHDPAGILARLLMAVRGLP